MDVNNGANVSSRQVDADQHATISEGMRDKLMDIMDEDNLDALKELIKNGLSINARDEYGWSILHYAVTYSRGFRFAIIEWLLEEKSMDVNGRSNDGRTPLFKAFERLSFESVVLLMDYGADVNIIGFQKKTPLQYLIENCFYVPKLPELHNIALLLLEKGAETNCLELDVGEYIENGQIEILSMLLYHNINLSMETTDCSRKTPFMSAIMSKDADMQSVLINYVEDFNAKDIFGCSLLEYALRYNSPYVEEIIKGGAVINNGVLQRLLCNYNKKDFNALLDSILASKNETKIRPMEYESCSKLIEKLVNFDASRSRAQEMICLLLSYGQSLSNVDLEIIYRKYGFSELFKICLHMDITIDYHYIPLNCSYPYWLLRPTLTVKGIETEFQGLIRQLSDRQKLMLEQSLKDSAFTKVFEQALNPQLMPSLLDLARNASRDYICRTYPMETIGQYVTFVQNLDVPTDFQKLLTYETELYSDADC